MNYWLAVILADMAIFYVGMRWAKLASKLFVITIPLLLWSGTMIYEAAMAPSEGETAANFVPNCGNDEQCWQTFARQREQLRGGEMARLFAPTAAFFMTLALAVLLVRRARFARKLETSASKTGFRMSGAAPSASAEGNAASEKKMSSEAGGHALSAASASRTETADEAEAPEAEKSAAPRRASDGPRQWWEPEDSEADADSKDILPPSADQDDSRWNPLSGRDD